MAVDRHGTVGVIWYDLRNDRPGDAATKRGFAAAFGLSAPQARNGPTDIFFVEIGPGRGRCHDDCKSDDDGDDHR
jgi:hypothetical protein